jgi:hypothetical protein
VSPTRLHDVLHIMKQVVVALKCSNPDNMHVGGRYTILLEMHMARLQKHLVPSLKPHNITPLNLDLGQTNLYMDSNGSLPYEFEGCMDEIRTETTESSWLSLPFDSSLLSFVMGSSQFLQCLEDDRLEFLWNLPKFHFEQKSTTKSGKPGQLCDGTINLPNVCGRVPSLQASRLRTMMLESHCRPDKILAHACSDNGLTSRLVEEVGFPRVSLSGHSCARSYGLPNTGYIAMADMCDKIKEGFRQVSAPVMADGDIGYGSPMNVKRTVQCFVEAGAADIMVEDQTWPKSMSVYRKIWEIIAILPPRMWPDSGQISCFEGRGIRADTSSI